MYKLLILADKAFKSYFPHHIKKKNNIYDGNASEFYLKDIFLKYVIH